MESKYNIWTTKSSWSHTRSSDANLRLRQKANHQEGRAFFRAGQRDTYEIKINPGIDQCLFICICAICDEMDEKSHYSQAAIYLEPAILFASKFRKIQRESKRTLNFLGVLYAEDEVKGDEEGITSCTSAKSNMPINFLFYLHLLFCEEVYSMKD